MEDGGSPALTTAGAANDPPVLTRVGDWACRWMDVPAPNPAFDVSFDAAAADERRMRAEPRPLARPVVVVGGYRAWTIAAASLASRLCAMTCRDRGMFAAMSYPWSSDFTRIAARLVRLVGARWPGGDEAAWTREVDVVGVSMGGLVARAAAAGVGRGGCDAPGRRLHIGRLFTLGTPHRGARLADLARPDAAARDMRAGSAFLARLDAARSTSGNVAGYELVCYTRLRDSWVGATRTSPAGHPTHWVSGWRVLSHVTVSMDTRIVADIARRLRGEDPLATSGAAGASPPPRN